MKQHELDFARVIMIDYQMAIVVLFGDDSTHTWWFHSDIINFSKLNDWARRYGK